MQAEKQTNKQNKEIWISTKVPWLMTDDWPINLPLLVAASSSAFACRSACAVVGIAVGYQECLAVCCPLLAVTFLSAQRTKIFEGSALLFFLCFHSISSNLFIHLFLWQQRLFNQSWLLLIQCAIRKCLSFHVAFY